MSIPGNTRNEGSEEECWEKYYKYAGSDDHIFISDNGISWAALMTACLQSARGRLWSRGRLKTD